MRPGFWFLMTQRRPFSFTIPIVLDASGADSASPLAPPREFRIFKAGINRTRKGPVLWDAPAEKAVLAAYEQQDRKVVIDRCHMAVADPPVDAPAAGWVNLEARDGELWATNVEWTPLAVAQLQTKPPEYAFFSPTIFSDEVNVDGQLCRRPNMLLTVSLTNIPAMDDIAPLMPLSIDARSTGVAAQRSFDEMTGSVARALGARFDDGDEAPSIECMFDDRVVFSHGGRLFEIPFSLDGSSAAFTGDAMEVRRMYEPIAGGVTMKTVLTMLGLEADASEATALAATTRLIQLRRELLALSGKPTEAEALGHFRGLVEKAAAVDTLSSELAMLRAEGLQAEVEALVEKNSTPDRDGRIKITPAEKEWAIRYGMRDLAEFRAYLETRPAIQLGAVRPPSEAHGGSPETGGLLWEEMTPLAKGKLHHDNAAQYEAVKRDYTARTGRRVG